MTKDKVLSIIFNFLDMLRGVNIKHFEQPVNYYYRKGASNLINKSTQIARSINSNIYTTDQFIQYLFLTALLQGQKGIYALNVNDIIKIRRMSNKAVKRDEEIINSICGKYELSVENLMEIRDNGETILFKLLKSNHISMAFVLKNYKNVLTIAEKNAILFNEEYKTFHDLLKLFIQFIQGEIWKKN